MKDSTIEWTDHTFSPWHGCVKVSPGCQNCYALALDRRFGRAVWGPAKTTPRMEMSAAYWKQPIRWNDAARKAGKRARVFCASMADVFEDHPQLPPIRARLWDLIRATPMLDWLLLTKRPENMYEMLPSEWRQAPRSNVWLGTSCEDQRRFDERIAPLLSTPAAVHFLSCEPLLGPINIGRCRPSWIIAGGESGPGARPADPNWFRSLRDQASAAGIAFHFKQHGAWGPWPAGVPFNERAEAFQWIRNVPSGNHFAVRYEPVYRVGKHAAGRLLDGVEHSEFPR